MSSSTFTFRYRVCSIIVRGSYPLSSTFKRLLCKREDKLSMSITIVFSSSCFVLTYQRRLKSISPVFLRLSHRSVSSHAKRYLLTPFPFLNSRPLTLPVVQVSFVMFCPAILLTLRLFLHYHTFIFEQTLLTLCL